VELQISPKRAQVHSAYRLKKFIDPKSSKFLNEEKQKKRKGRKSYISQGQKESVSKEEIKAHERNVICNMYV
jgi:hypothetical protein